MKNKILKHIIIAISIAAIGYGAFRITEYVNGIIRWKYAKIKVIEVPETEIDDTPLE